MNFDAVLKETDASLPRADYVAPHRSSGSIRLGEFSGTTSLDVFMKRFAICAKYGRWTKKEEELHQLSCALSGEASDILCESDADSITTVEQLTQRLYERFGTAAKTTLFQTELHSRRQQPNETLSTLVADIRRLISHAYHGLPQQYVETIAIQSFVGALKNRTLAKQICLNAPRTLQDAYHFALRYESLELAERSRLEFSQPPPRRTSYIKKQEASAATPPIRPLMETICYPPVQPGYQPQRPYFSHLNTLTPSAHRPSFQHQTIRPLMAGFQRRRPAYPSSHTANRPWETTHDRPQPRPRNGARKEEKRRCHICHEIGHLKFICPYRKPNNETSEQLGRIIHNDVAVYIELTVNGHQTRALLDSGSKSSVISPSLVDQRDLSEIDTELTAANGMKLRVDGAVNLTCSIDEYNYDLACLVSPDIQDVIILGASWFQQNRCV